MENSRKSSRGPDDGQLVERKIAWANHFNGINDSFKPNNV